MEIQLWCNLSTQLLFMCRVFCVHVSDYWNVVVRIYVTGRPDDSGRRNTWPRKYAWGYLPSSAFMPMNHFISMQSMSFSLCLRVTLLAPAVARQCIPITFIVYLSASLFSLTWSTNYISNTDCFRKPPSGLPHGHSSVFTYIFVIGFIFNCCLHFENSYQRELLGLL